MEGDFTKPMLFTAETPQRKFVAYIDPDNRFCIEDKLSQVTTALFLLLNQLYNPRAAYCNSKAADSYRYFFEGFIFKRIFF